MLIFEEKSENTQKIGDILKDKNWSFKSGEPPKGSVFSKSNVSISLRRIVFFFHVN